MRSSDPPAFSRFPSVLAQGLLVGIAFVWVACQGELGHVAGPSDHGVDAVHGSKDDPSGTDDPNGPGADGAACDARLPSRLVLLSDFQHVTALRTLLGDDAIQGDDAPQRQLKPFTQKGVVVNTSLVHTRAAWAEQAAEKLRQHATDLTGCASIDRACAESFLRAFLPKAFRREVTDEELADLMEVYEIGASTAPTNGLVRAVEAALGSPSFLYRRELGSEDDNGTLRLDPYELASLLSFALLDGPPDEELLRAAAAGELSSADAIKGQVTRLLAMSSVQESLTSTLLSAWGIGNLFGAVKDPKLFPEINPELRQSMYRETELLVNDVLWDRKAPVSELLSTRRSFVNAPLATLYGIEPPSGSSTDFAPVTLPEERAGLLTQASVLSMLSRSDTTSVVARGLFVRGLLCMPKLPAPPDSLAGEIEKLLKQDMTERERADARAKTPTCAACHANIDPFGLMLERYDALGRYRTTLKGAAIDTSVDIPGSVLPGHYQDVVGFSNAAAQSSDFAACLTTRLFSYATQDDALQPSDCQVKAALADADLASLTMPDLVARVLTSPALQIRQKESP